MIRPLRQRHRATLVFLAIFLPIAFAMSLVARRPIPLMTTLPSLLAATGSDFHQTVWQPTNLWPNQPIATRLYRNDAGDLALELNLGNLVRPDLLVYWAPGTEASVHGLPGNARLLGAVSAGRRLTLPKELFDETGRLVLYSLADYEAVAESAPILAPKN